ncbi:PRC-barrel domain-containing protein [Streptomyces sp. NPDC005202]|uniref:PRC-barrel domain-containing protein n=1 Tax=Streptomyces sp. NPDC005202 TaxID=3157021 RepID=UPI0033B21F74
MYTPGPSSRPSASQHNHDVVDPKGHKIGVLEAIYVDTTTDQRAMAAVRTGLPTRRRLVFVPLDEAILGPDYVKVSYAKALVRKAPSIGTRRDSRGPLAIC